VTSALQLAWNDLPSAIVDQEVGDFCSLLMVADRVFLLEKLSILRRPACSPCVSPNLGSLRVPRTAPISRTSRPTTYLSSSM